MPSGRGCALRDDGAGSPTASALESGARTETVRSPNLTVSPDDVAAAARRLRPRFSPLGVNSPEKATGWQRVKTSRTMLHCAQDHETNQATASQNGASPKFHDPVSQCEHTQTSRPTSHAMSQGPMPFLKHNDHVADGHKASHVRLSNAELNKQLRAWTGVEPDMGFASWQRGRWRAPSVDRYSWLEHYASMWRTTRAVSSRLSCSRPEEGLPQRGRLRHRGVKQAQAGPALPETVSSDDLTLSPDLTRPPRNC